MLGLERDAVKLVPHESEWLDAFEREQSRLHAALGERGYSIEHIGSTAVRGLDASPILDMAVGLPRGVEPAGIGVALESLGYVRFTEGGPNAIAIFALESSPGVQTHRLRLMRHGTGDWSRQLLLRDWLRHNEEARRAYQQAKRTLAEEHARDPVEYQEGKSSLFVALIEDAEDHRARSVVIDPVSSAPAQTLRRRLLRPEQPIEASVYPLDDAVPTLHLGAFEGRRMVGAGSIFLEGPPHSEGRRSWRIRGMATAPEVRGLGLGGRLLKGLVEHAERRRGVEIWCNARTTAAGFYARHGFEVRGAVFDLEPIGPHVRMFRSLRSA